ncbi:hypothetical protein POF51_22460 [Brevibacillus sp. AG]|uniref:hypothetical protein n=1 Tax=Brevibacillus sp. AG TaxID=3020891 RepID=UPI002330C52C|nr:hypothetical protein [Brevibacillus sp. AG]MDC0763492.1 hypothetical protein [Brevibacillus sp. AG]
MKYETSMATITGVDVEKQKITPTLQPSEFELGWLESLVEVHSNQMGRECVVIPCQSSYGQSLVVPFPILLPRIGKLISVAPLKVNSDNREYTDLMVTVQLTEADQGQNVLMIPVINDKRYVIAGVER